MKPTKYAVILVLTLLGTLTASTGFVSSFASANPDGETLQLSMPIEHINYTITDVNGSLWAQVDGFYPISFLNQFNCGVLPMIYPMAPNSTNIHLYLDELELEWSNYTQAYPDYLHKTALGDWWIISGVLENLSDSFLLQIHYEHPVEQVNGSYVFLYDLNIVDYLSMQSPVSRAYFTVRFEGNFSDVHVYTAPPNGVTSQWQPKTFISTPRGLNFEMHSQFGVDLPGDLVVVFSEGTGNTLNEHQDVLEPSWAIPIILNVVFIAILLYVKRKAVLSIFLRGIQLFKQHLGLIRLKASLILIVYCLLRARLHVFDKWVRRTRRVEFSSPYFSPN